MSATFKLAAKKKYTQNDLRRLMSEQKAKATKEALPTKVDSPLAKYDELGQLTCILCKTIVRSEAVWKVHINAKQHKQNIELAKQLKEKTQNFTKPASIASNKRNADPIASNIPSKVPKGILKNNLSLTSTIASAASTVAGTASSANGSDLGNLPDNFFDNDTSNYFARTLKKTSIKTNLVNIKRGTEAVADHADEVMDVDQQKNETIPEGFFDDPIKDAKARHLDYKDPTELEWEKFQQEIKEASDFSNAIIAEEQEEATAERQIDEIHEQMRNWSRVLELEKKKERAHINSKTREQQQNHTQMEEGDVDDDNDGDDDDDDIDEYLDWRAKKAHK